MWRAKLSLILCLSVKSTNIFFLITLYGRNFTVFGHWKITTFSITHAQRGSHVFYAVSRDQSGFFKREAVMLSMLWKLTDPDICFTFYSLATRPSKEMHWRKFHTICSLVKDKRSAFDSSLKSQLWGSSFISLNLLIRKFLSPSLHLNLLFQLIAWQWLQKF